MRAERFRVSLLTTFHDDAIGKDVVIRDEIDANLVGVQLQIRDMLTDENGNLWPVGTTVTIERTR